MFNKTLFILFTLCSISCLAQQTVLHGYAYEQKTSPDHKEWQSPERLALNKLQPRSYFCNFDNINNARKVLPEFSIYVNRLNGTWKFLWTPHPDSVPQGTEKPLFDDSAWDDVSVPLSWNIRGIQKDGSLKYGVPIYVNQKIISFHEVKVDDWKKGVMRTPPESWTTFKYRNEVGCFRKHFSLPKGWNGREVFINFDGVDSFFYLWINGKYVGFSKNSRNVARFNITPYINNGDNIISLQVYRLNDGSFLETQDMFRLPGIFRDVYLSATPQTHISNIIAVPDLDDTYNNGSLKISCQLTNESGKALAPNYKIRYTIYPNKLYSDSLLSKKPVATLTQALKANEIHAHQAMQVVSIPIAQPKCWSAEAPYRYTLIAELLDKRGCTLDIISIFTGIRKVEIKDTPASADEFGLAGRYYYINGKTVKLKGINRHETNPETGKVISREQMLKEIFMMKQVNINHVRNSHYPTDPYWYYLCDKYGIYVEDEANIESHQYYYGKESLSHPKEWQAAHVARVMEMAQSNVNHPAIVIWSLGNEAGPGDNFKATYDELKKFDQSRPVQYERNNDIVDMGSNQYPSIAWVKEAVKGAYKIKYPFHISEYAHSMGNACGNLVDYWDAIESTNFFCGGAIWDWVDQAMYNYTKEGQRYLAYGGDFGDFPNDGQFVMNGILFADFTPKPQYYEVKKVYQNVRFSFDATHKELNLFNKNYFTNLEGYSLRWELMRNGKPIAQDTLTIDNLPARSNKAFGINLLPIPQNEAAYYHLNVYLCLNHDKPWAKRGYAIASEQFALNQPKLNQHPASHKQERSLHTTESDSMLMVSGKDFAVTFDLKHGLLYQLKYGQNEIISQGNGPTPELFRAFTNNDNWAYSAWFKNGLHNLHHQITTSVHYQKDALDRLLIIFNIHSQAPYGTEILGGTASGHNSLKDLTDKPFGPKDFYLNSQQIWTIAPDGTIMMEVAYNSNNPYLALARMGYVMKTNKEFDRLTYLGRGPVGNYPDRQTSSFVGLYESSIAEQMVAFPKPQDCANHQEVSWMKLTNKQGEGFAVTPIDQPVTIQALPYTALQMTLAGHLHELPTNEVNYLHIDRAITGLGGNSCGQAPPLKPDRVYATPGKYGFVLTPIYHDSAPQIAHAQPSLSPIMIERDNEGIVTLMGSPGKTLLYQMGTAKTKPYRQPLEMKKGGQLKVFYKENPQIYRKSSFEAILGIKTTINKVSSEETDGGEASNAIDNDPSTIWHSMYSVTVAKYPHWIIFDAGSQQRLTAISYLPRQDGSETGNIKDYEIYLSEDGINWGQPVAKGTLPRSSQKQLVTLPKPQLARYVKLVALSEQQGRDYVSAAEISIIAQ